MNIIIQTPGKAEAFANLFQHVKLFTEHINITFENTHMYLQSMDSSKVSIFEIKLPSTWFDIYEKEDEGAITLGLSSTLLFRILNTREKEQKTQLIFDKNDTDKLFINFLSENKSVFNKRFELPLVDLDCDLMDIPETECQAEFSINSVNFANILNQMKLFGDTLEIECNEEIIKLHSISPESGKMLVEINIEDLTSYAINEGESMKLSFSLNILHNIFMYSKISKTVEVRLTDNFPMKIIFNLGDESANLIFYLAPKLGED
jgi:proliferating cell nuclear antigen PCNA